MRTRNIVAAALSAVMLLPSIASANVSAAPTAGAASWRGNWHGKHMPWLDWTPFWHRHTAGAAMQAATPVNASTPMIAGHTVAGTLQLTATAYAPTYKDNYPYGPVDYYGKPLVAGDVAVDPRVIPLGSLLWVTGYTSPDLPAGGFLARAVDEGNAIQGNRIDIFINGSETRVSTFGIQHVTAYVLK